VQSVGASGSTSTGVDGATRREAGDAKEAPPSKKKKRALQGYAGFSTFTLGGLCPVSSHGRAFACSSIDAPKIKLTAGQEQVLLLRLTACNHAGGRA
jgi:uncharacterized Zn-binding protein involved in type VI secretion